MYLLFHVVDDYILLLLISCEYYCVFRGLYALQLQPWLQAFGPDKIRVMSIKDIQGGQKKVTYAIVYNIFQLFFDIMHPVCQQWLKFIVYYLLYCAQRCDV